MKPSERRALLRAPAAPPERPFPRLSAPPSLRRLRLAVGAMFALLGVVFGSWAARIPDVAEQAQVGPAQLGGALLCISLGALAAMQLTGALCVRLGPGLVSVSAVTLLSASAVPPALATSPVHLCTALLLFGAGTGAANVAANSVGVLVEAEHDRPLMPLLHAGFSAGGLVGALLGGAVSTTIAPSAHLLAVAAVGLLTGAALAPTLLHADALAAPRRTAVVDVEASPRAVRPLVLVLGALAGCTAFGEGAISDWSAVHLRTALEASPAVAAAGYASFSLSMAVGRLAGGPLLERLGDRRLLSGGAAVATAGGLLAVLSPGVALALVGFLLIGLGLANVFPLAIGRAGAVGGAGGVALASTIGYAGLLGGPPLIGLVAEWTSTAVALSAVPLLAAVAGLLARRVPVEHAGRPLLGLLALPLPRRRLAALGARCRSAVVGHAQALTVLVPSPDARRGSTSPYPGLEFLAV